jgi:hypothetical protein
MDSKQTMKLTRTDLSQLVEKGRPPNRLDEPLVIQDIPEPWRSQFLRYLTSDNDVSSVHLKTCRFDIWKRWIDYAESLCTAHIPTELWEGAVSLKDLKVAYKKGQQRKQWFLKSRPPYPMSSQIEATDAGYTLDKPKKRSAFIRGWEEAENAPSNSIENPKNA